MKTEDFKKQSLEQLKNLLEEEKAGKKIDLRLKHHLLGVEAEFKRRDLAEKRAKERRAKIEEQLIKMGKLQPKPKEVSK